MKYFMQNVLVNQLNEFQMKSNHMFKMITTLLNTEVSPLHLILTGGFEDLRVAHSDSLAVVRRIADAVIPIYRRTRARAMRNVEI